MSNTPTGAHRDSDERNQSTSRAKRGPSAHWSVVGGCVLALTYWFVEAMLHFAVRHDGAFRTALLPVDDRGEFWKRVLTATLFVVFGVVMDVGLTRLRRAHQERGRLVDQLEARTADLAERVKELGCLYGINELARRDGATIEEILEEAAGLIPASWQYPEIAGGRILYEGKEFSAGTPSSAEWRQKSDIVIDGTPIGSIEVYYTKGMPERDEGPFLKEERKLIDSMAARLAGIIEQKRAERALRESEARLQQLSRTDGLTGLLNRRGWNECLAEEELRAQRLGHPSCVMVADLDGLKTTNDRLGHAAGDDLLRRTADCIRRSVRDVDKVARIGGDEFAVLCVECDAKMADILAKRVETSWVAAGIRACWGIAMRTPASGLDGAVAEADRLMYAMKGDRRTDSPIPQDVSAAQEDSRSEDWC